MYTDDDLGTEKYTTCNANKTRNRHCIVVACTNCGKAFYKPKKRVSVYNYCDNSCMLIHARNNRTKRLMDRTEKACPKCKEVLPIESFGKSGYRIRSFCKPCGKTYAKKPTVPQYVRYSLKTNYGMTLEDFEEILKTQNYSCAVCMKHVDEVTSGMAKYNKLSVDHDHSTGKIRGLLCVNCNLGLGNFADTEEILLSAIEYLRKHKN